jgi:putative Ca2+/H+ antiporter (TMEM165/GDT1 family)
MRSEAGAKADVFQPISAARMEGFVAFGSAFGLIALLELGDKTQLLTISLATRQPWAAVLAGAAIGLVTATAVGATIGGLMAAALTSWLTLIRVVGGLVFIALGAWTFIKEIRHDEPEAAPEAAEATHRSAFLQSAALLFLAEFGDKTQLAVIILAASYAAPVSVFAGAGLAETVIAGTSVVIGTNLSRFLTKRWIGLVSSSLFLAAGVLLVLDALVLA